MRKRGNNVLLKEIRKKRGFNQQFMANKLNIGLSTYNQYENGGRNIPKDVAISIAKLLDVNIKDIFLPSRFTIREKY